MRTSIICVTHALDIPWLEYNLKSARKFCKGFSNFVILCPLQELDKFLPLESYSSPDLPVLVKNYLEFPGKGMVHHEAMICCADLFLPDADYILHTDADCIFTEPVTPADYIVEGRPVLVIQSFERLGRDAGCYKWKACVDKALGTNALYETMQRHPAVHIPEVYKETRRRIEEVHRVPFIDFVIRQENSFPQGYAEFPTLGTIALERFHDRYEFIEVGKDETPRDKLKQSWSHWARRDPSKAQQIWQELAAIVN